MALCPLGIPTLQVRAGGSIASATSIQLGVVLQAAVVIVAEKLSAKLSTHVPPPIPPGIAPGTRNSSNEPTLQQVTGNRANPASRSAPPLGIGTSHAGYVSHPKEVADVIQSAAPHGVEVAGLSEESLQPGGAK